MKRILVCLDGSTRAPHVMQTAVDLAQRLDARLVLFRAVGVPQASPFANAALPPGDLPEALVEDALRHLATVAEHAPPGLVESSHGGVGIAWDAICAAGRKENVDLIVIGSHGYSGMDRLLGTTAAKVVNHADRDVLVVRART